MNNPGHRIKTTLLTGSLTLFLKALLLAAPLFAAGEDYTLVEILPREEKVFTQGLEFYRGLLYESSGLYRHSFIRYGTAASTHKRRALPDDRFAEGLTILDDRLYLLTWRAGKCLVFDPQTLEQTGEFSYRGEGWGLTNNGRELIMSNGGPTLTFIDPASPQRSARRLRVHHRGKPVRDLNELEWHDGVILANQWKRDRLLVIDERTGQVLEIIDLGNLYPRFLRPADADVMNGIAYDAESGTWLITGKRWPVFFRVKLRLPRAE